MISEYCGHNEVKYGGLFMDCKWAFRLIMESKEYKYAFWQYNYEFWINSKITKKVPSLASVNASIVFSFGVKNYTYRASKWNIRNGESIDLETMFIRPSKGNLWYFELVMCHVASNLYYSFQNISDMFIEPNKSNWYLCKPRCTFIGPKCSLFISKLS